MIKRIEANESEKNKFTEKTLELPTLIATSLHFIGIRHNENSLIVLVFEMVVEDIIYEFNICLSCDKTDIECIEERYDEWNLNNRYIPTDSRSVLAFYMAESPYTADNELYMVHGSEKDGDINILLSYNYFYMIQYVYYHIKSFKEIKKENLEEFHILMKNIWWDKKSLYNINIRGIYIPNEPKINTLNTIYILIDFNDEYMIFRTSVLRSSLRRSVFKQSIVSRNIELLDDLYEEARKSGKDYYCIASSEKSIPIEYKTIDDNDKIIENTKIVILTESDDYSHEPSAIIVERKFISILEDRVSMYINSKLY